LSGLQGVSVLVTGADGFIGSHLTERLAAEGAAVRAFCLYNSQGSCGWLEAIEAGVRGRLEVRLGDIRDARFVEAACSGVEVVFHLAALIAIPYSYAAPESFVDTNVRGTLNLLEGARRNGVRRIVHTSTSEVYGTPTTLPIRESHPLQAQSPYAASKIAADQFALSYYRSFGTPVTVLRPFNTYGPRQSARAVLGTILTQLVAGRREVALGRLDTRRDFTYVSDTVEAFVRAATTPGLEGDVIQVGTGRSTTVRELFEAACRALGVSATIREDRARLRPDASEVLVLEADPGHALDRLGWTPGVDLEEGLRRTAAWFRTNAESSRA